MASPPKKLNKGDLLSTLTTAGNNVGAIALTYIILYFSNSLTEENLLENQMLFWSTVVIVSIISTGIISGFDLLRRYLLDTRE